METLKQIYESRLQTFCFEIISKIKRIDGIEKQIDLFAISDGMVGLYRYKDGNAYEITVKPASLGSYKGLFTKYTKLKDK